MRNEIFQQIKKNKLKFYSECMEYPKKERDQSSEARTSKTTRLLNLLKGFNLPRYQMPFKRSAIRNGITIRRMHQGLVNTVFHRARILFDKAAKLNAWLEKRADQIKYQMADFLMVLFADEEHLIPLTQSTNNNGFAGFSSTPKSIKAGSDSAFYFYLPLQSSMAWFMLKSSSIFSGGKSLPIILKNPNKLVQTASRFSKRVARIKLRLTESCQRFNNLLSRQADVEKARDVFQRKKQGTLNNALFSTWKFTFRV